MYWKSLAVVSLRHISLLCLKLDFDALVAVRFVGQKNSSKKVNVQDDFLFALFNTRC